MGFPVPAAAGLGGGYNKGGGEWFSRETCGLQ